MKIPNDLNTGNLTPNLTVVLKQLIKEIDEDGYFTIIKILQFRDKDAVVVNIRGKDPMLSVLKNCTIESKVLKYLEPVIYGHVSYNFKIEDNEVMLPRSINVEKFDFNAPHNINNIGGDILYAPQTPVEVLWRLAKFGYNFMWEGCSCVPCSNIYFGYDNFSIKVDYVDAEGNQCTQDIMKYENGCYSYTDIRVIADVDKAVIDDYASDDLFGSSPVIEIIKDDLGREREVYRVNLKVYEKNMFNSSRFSKVYDKEYTLTVLTRLYSITSYLNGLNMLLADLGVKCQQFNLPYRKKSSFSIDSDKQHDTFSIQSVWYDADIIEDVKRLYLTNKEKMIEYLKTKDESLREEIYSIFVDSCSDKYGVLLHYFVNGVLDALAIQKGDKASRIEILKGYTNTVHKEFIMYACYYYDIRTTFIRNNFRINKEYGSTFVMNDYNGYYFLVG